MLNRRDLIASTAAIALMPTAANPAGQAAALYAAFVEAMMAAA